MTKKKHRRAFSSHDSKRTKILLATLIPFAIIIIALSIFLGFYFSKKHGHPSAGDSNITYREMIKQSTISESPDYRVAKETDVWFNSGDSDKISFGHDLFNLKAFQENLFEKEHKEITTFYVSGQIDFGFLVDFDMDCHLVGVNHELTQIRMSGQGCGIIVGETTQPDASKPCIYTGNMDIENNMTFNISSSTYVSGVNIGSIAPSSSITINGTFNLTSMTNVYGVDFGTSSTISGDVTINGTFALTSENNAYGVNIYSTNDSKQTINGTFTISSKIEAYGVNISGTRNGSTLTVNGTFSIFANIAFGILLNLYSSSPGSVQTIDGTFFLLANVEALGVCYASASSGNTVSLSMNTTQFFSNKTDASNIYTITTFTGSYKWNGSMVTSATASTADASLTTKEIADSSNNNFKIKVINGDGKSSTSKSIFNYEYWKKLDECISNMNDQSITKPWLTSIRDQILSSTAINVDDTISSSYLIAAHNNIYVDSVSSFQLEHRMLDLKAYSSAATMSNRYSKWFIVTKDINFGFLIDFDQSCIITSTNNSKMSYTNGDGIGCGIMVGSTTNQAGNYSYSGDMYIDSSMTFIIVGIAQTTGVRIHSTTADSTQIINGVFTVSGFAPNDGIHGVLVGTAAGFTTINGVFTISGLTNAPAGHDKIVGVGFSSTTSGSSQTISGIFTISSTCDNSFARGVDFEDAAAGSITINGTFTISSFSEPVGVWINSTTSGSSQTISGIFTISYFSSTTYTYSKGVYIENNNVGSSTTINGTFTIFVANTSLCYGIQIDNSTATTLFMSSSQFFSNKVDSAYTYLPTGTTYNWNGLPITTAAGDNRTTADTTLELTDIKDNDTAANFSIKVIDTATRSNKTIFNTAYKTALQSYVATCGESAAKPWLESIINKIPLS